MKSNESSPCNGHEDPETVLGESQSRRTRRLKRHTHQPYHILRSIDEDARFVRQAADELQLPLALNLRCGRWYADPATVPETCYFKSTDGHYGKWDVPTRRLNLHLLALIEKQQGVIIVDSTRRGKRFPDALSRTVPLWCAAMNALLFPNHAPTTDGEAPPSDAAPAQHAPLWTLPSLVSKSEHAGMQHALDHAILPRLRSTRLRLPALSKPLRPLWIGPDSFAIQRVDPATLDFHPVYCLTASRVVDSADGYRSGNYVYIQGAADDDENWSSGLTPAVFWANRESILASAEACDAFLDNLKSSSSATAAGDADGADGYASDLPGTWLTVGSRGAARPASRPWDRFTHVINCTDLEYPDYAADEDGTRARFLCLQVPEGKKGQAALGAAFPVVDAWFRENVVPSSSESKPPRVLVHCNQGRDRSVAVALLLVLKHFGDAVTGDRRDGDASRGAAIDKDAVREALVWITNHHPRSLPSRASLKRLNSYLMGPPQDEDDGSVAHS
ncbi:tRNA A64-2'-O-ribosylphosphate transferase [Blastocladiella emersonii ATCC 22665]|nr:tRNA A64-2'-O-ribosylphosphate transferase [Blastocladiella emersonii ATCC 22665]